MTPVRGLLPGDIILDQLLNGALHNNTREMFIVSIVRASHPDSENVVVAVTYLTGDGYRGSSVRLRRENWHIDYCNSIAVIRVNDR